MSDKNGVGVTVVSHDSESRTHVKGCGGAGCYSKDVTYSGGASVAQLTGLTAVSSNCEQMIKFECKDDVSFIEGKEAWWVSRDGSKMFYWGGAIPDSGKCACGMTNTCKPRGTGCNCENAGGAGGSGWREDSGLLTSKSRLPVTQLRFGDVDQPHEEGYHTLGKLKCYGRVLNIEQLLKSLEITTHCSEDLEFTFSRTSSSYNWELQRKFAFPG